MVKKLSQIIDNIRIHKVIDNPIDTTQMNYSILYEKN